MNESLSPARGGMQTYDAFAARVTARSDGVGTDRPIASTHDRGSNPPSSTSRDAESLATLQECYDAYVSLHRGGLWFDVNPFWCPRLRCYYLRCEPNAKGAEQNEPQTNSVNDETLKRRPNEKPSTKRSRAVIVPVAVRIGSVSHATLREISKLGDAWRRETNPNDAGDDDDGAAGKTDRDASSNGEVKNEGDLDTLLFRGDLEPEIGVSLCVVDGDGTAVVLRVAYGLIEPEDVEPPADDAAAFEDDDANDGALGGHAGQDCVGDFSDDEEEDLDERDAGEVGGASGYGTGTAPNDDEIAF